MATSQCPEDAKRVQSIENGKIVNFCVSVSQTAMTHTQALRYCEGLGGFLPSRFIVLRTGCGIYFI